MRSGPRESGVPTTDDRLNHNSGHGRADGGEMGSGVVGQEREREVGVREG